MSQSLNCFLTSPVLGESLMLEGGQIWGKQRDNVVCGKVHTDFAADGRKLLGRKAEKEEDVVAQIIKLQILSSLSASSSKNSVSSSRLQ